MTAAALLALAGCATGAGEAAGAPSVPAPAPASVPPDASPGPPIASPGPSVAAGADVDGERPAYAAGELAQAIAGDRARLADQERQLAELEERASDGNPATTDQLVQLAGDLGVRRRFVALLEACANGLEPARCPLRLDEPAWSYDPAQAAPPPLTAKLRFDRDSWRVVARELRGRACACRSVACVDSVDAAIDALEPRPMREVQGDDAAASSIVRARECLVELRGKRAIPAVTPVSE